MPGARKLWDQVVDDFLDENMSGSYWRRHAFVFVSKYASAVVTSIGIVAIYRLGNYVPLPGVDAPVLDPSNAAAIGSSTFGISSPGATYFVRRSSR